MRLKKVQFNFTVEDMLKYGQDMMESQGITIEEKQFHEFTTAMIMYELGAEDHRKKGIYDNILVIAGMSNYLRSLRTTMKIKPRVLIKSIKHKIKAYNKYSLEGWYYRSGERYLRAAGLRF